MATEASLLASHLVNLIKNMPEVLTTSHISELDTALGKLIDVLPGEAFSRGCKLLDDLNVYKLLADTFLHKDRPAKFASTDQTLLKSETTELKRALLAYLGEIPNV